MNNSQMTDLFNNNDRKAPTNQKNTNNKSSLSPQDKLKKMQSQLIEKSKEHDYNAEHIEVLEGLEPVRKRPGMYVGGTDEKALHHLFAEVLDNSMDEVVAGHASFIEIHLDKDGYLSVSDNGRGIPVDNHPKYKDKSALEVIMTTLHSGGKFSSKVYETAGGLHGVGISVVNALSEKLEVEIARSQKLYCQNFSRGKALSPLEYMGSIRNRRGTKIRFKPDAEIFKTRSNFRPAALYRMAMSKAYIFAGVEIRWNCAKELIIENDTTPSEAILNFPEGLKDYLKTTIGNKAQITQDFFVGKAKREGEAGKVEWAIAWYENENGFIRSYCNTVPTAEGGTHVAGMRAALVKGLRNYGELKNNKKAVKIIADDVLNTACILISVFIKDPEFQGQTKEKLSSLSAQKLVEDSLRDNFDHWLIGNPNQADKLLDFVIEISEERQRLRRKKDVNRKSATSKLRLPGKLADCISSDVEKSELFIVEGDSAGGSAKQGRNRQFQAILPLRGKILNVANSSKDKIAANQQISDMLLALGCNTGRHYNEDELRYGKVIIMTDADVDGAHIAALLITYFFQQLPKLIENGHLYIAVPPLYRITQSGKTYYARDDEHKDKIIQTKCNQKSRIEIGRFKGLGEMLPRQLKETTMMPENRTLLQVIIPETDMIITEDIVKSLMGNNPEARFNFIQENASFATELDI